MVHWTLGFLLILVGDFKKPSLLYKRLITIGLINSAILAIFKFPNFKFDLKDNLFNN